MWKLCGHSKLCQKQCSAEYRKNKLIYDCKMKSFESLSIQLRLFFITYIFAYFFFWNSQFLFKIQSTIHLFSKNIPRLWVDDECLMKWISYLAITKSCEIFQTFNKNILLSYPFPMEKFLWIMPTRGFKKKSLDWNCSCWYHYTKQNVICRRV